MTLALFHTLFNVLGVLLIWPVANILIKWLSNQFKSKGADEEKPIYLNKHALSLPSLALHALNKELERVGNYALAMAKDSINFESASPSIIYKDSLIKSLINSIGDYTTKLYKQNLTDEISAKLPAILRISQYYNAISDLSLIINTDKLPFESPIDPGIQQQIHQYLKHSIHLLNMTHIEQKIVTKVIIDKQLQELEAEYQALKSLLLRRGAEGMISIAKMDKKMTQLSRIRRINQQAVKAYTYFISLDLYDDKNIESDTITTTV
jgi:phosphate:Na+ symporter